jgi:cyanoexosortase A
MKQIGFFKGVAIPSVPFLLMVLGSGLIAIHLTLTWRMGSSDSQVMSLMFWLTAAYFIWQRRDRLKLNASVAGSPIGSLLIFFLLLKSTAVTSTSFLLGYPFVAGVSFALIASGFRGLRQYWQELTLLFFLGIPKLVLPSLIDPTPLVARFAGLLLRYTGFAVTQHGINIQLPGGSIDVLPGCSGLESMAQLLGLAVLFLLVLPLPWHWAWKLSLPFAAVTIAFVVNAARVALLAVLVAQGQPDAIFDYWHLGQGSLIFSGIAVLLFVLLVLLLIQLSATRSCDRKDSISS